MHRERLENQMEDSEMSNKTKMRIFVAIGLAIMIAAQIWCRTTIPFIIVSVIGFLFMLYAAGYEDNEYKEPTEEHKIGTFRLKRVRKIKVRKYR